jgi:predicted TIM-barrel fold metal-dependent hydrolase
MGMETSTSPVESVLARVPLHDVDTHLAEPQDLWTRRIGAKWGDKAPHVVATDTSDYRKNAVQTWVSGGDKVCDLLASVVGEGRDEDTRRAGWDPQVRLEWMQRHGVFSQVLYPNVISFHPRAFIRMERDLGFDCIRAYNDFQSEFTSASPDRLIPIMNLPWWDVEESVRELDRCHTMGHRGINFGWEFEKLGFPRLRDAHWAPILNEAQERGLPISFHIGFNTETVGTGQLEAMGDLDRVGFSAAFFLGNARCIIELIVGGLCERFPNLKFVSVESGSGYLPYLVETLDWQYLNSNLHQRYPHLLLPSEYFRRQIYGTFWFESNVARLVDLYPDNFMFESDFPHSTSLTPCETIECVQGPRDTIVANFQGVSEDVLVKVLHDNAARVYGLR